MRGAEQEPVFLELTRSKLNLLPCYVLESAVVSVLPRGLKDEVIDVGLSNGQIIAADLAAVVAGFSYLFPPPPDSTPQSVPQSLHTSASGLG